ncbi:uncharacterized protein LOC133195149 [Saccostrea echinata]|uniref:uncharacterized protein LOC133195149 n=1 Tax=Saccostrea echinata TaxID=191078 RepID=UPI002A81889C|nr:uncharacterized protein LOC133195149 [Saccostrea echinata]
MTNAYQMVKEKKMSVRKASKIFRVPDTTLRDRVLLKVDPETAVFGKTPVLDNLEEANLVNHFKTMASFGYGYTRQECINIATDYAIFVGKRTPDKPFSMKWMRCFLKRWPELKVLKPRGLEHVRAKMASSETVSKYFENLCNTLSKHDLYGKPHLIFNVDEKGISVDHKPPAVVGDSAYCPQSVTSGRGKTITILGGGSASGVSIPPFFVFPGKRMMPELLSGASPGASGTVSETGWSNGLIFRHYLEHHFLKFVPRDEGQILLLLDGHKSHVSVELVEWASQKGIIIFILPAHTSHVLQPMDVACYGPFQNIYNNQCHKLIRETAATITRYNICEVACKAYTKALSPENIQSGFRRTGIYPLCKDAVPSRYLVPAEVFKGLATEIRNESQENERGFEQKKEENVENYVVKLQQKENHLKEKKSAGEMKVRKTMSKIVSGREISESVYQRMKDHANSQRKQEKDIGSKKHQRTSLKKNAHLDDIPGPSTMNLTVSEDLQNSSDSDSDVEMDPSKLCCICKKFQPDELKRCISLVFVKWAQCDKCSHWVHLIYCSPIRVVRRNDQFFCPHCNAE